MKELWEEIFDAVASNLAEMLWPGKEIGKLESSVAKHVLVSQGFDDYLKDVLGPARVRPSEAIVNFVTWLNCHTQRVPVSTDSLSIEAVQKLADAFCEANHYAPPRNNRPDWINPDV